MRRVFRCLTGLFFLLSGSCFFTTPSVNACTVVSAVAADGQVWNANNEDGPFGVANFINVFPKSGDANYGFYTLSYFSPELGSGRSIQGGTNEAGLTFDFNAIDLVEDFDLKGKKAFPGGDDAVLPFILGNMSSVQEVMDFFSTYWFEIGFRTAQMHVADREGRFAIISASGMKLVEKGEPLVSTNFDVCGNEDGSSCWRYPLATSKLSSSSINLMTMISICLETAQKNGATMYSNVQNLTTGDIWFFSKHDPNTIVQTNISEMLQKGKKSYTFSDLKSLREVRETYNPIKSVGIDLADSVKVRYTGQYYNSYTGKILVRKHADGIEILLEDGSSEILVPQSEKIFFVPTDDAFVEFSFDKEAEKMALDLYENGNWTIRGWKKSWK